MSASRESSAPAPEEHGAGRLFDVRGVGPLPDWGVGTLVVLLWTLTVVLTYREYSRSGTSFGIAGPAFFMLFAPIYEEMIFRGWILGRLERRWNARVAIVLSSALFGLWHLRNVFWREPDAIAFSVLYTGAFLGPLFGWLTLRTRSLWPAVVLHFLNNLGFYVR